MIFIPARLGYASLGSKFFNPSNGLVEVIFTLLDNGIVVTVSPSKSAPERIPAVLLLIPIASNGVVPIIFFPSAFLLLTVRIGISNVPA